MLKWQWLLALAFPVVLKVGDAQIVRLAESGRRSQVRVERLPLQVDDWRGTTLPSTQVSRKLLPQDTVVQRAYLSPTRGTLAVSLVYSNKWESLHPPQNCLKAAGFEIVRETTVDLAQPRGPVRASVITGLKKPSEVATELYLFADAHETSSTWLERYGRIMLEHGRAGAQSSCLLLVTRVQDGSGAPEASLEPVVKFTESFLPYVQQSLQP